MPKYEPRHDTQYEPRTWSSPLDCNMAAAADAARYWSLGLKDHNHAWYRDHAQNPDGSPDKTGGTNIDQAAEVLDDAGIPSVHFDGSDGRGWSDVEAVLAGAGIVIAHGDYGSVPRSLRGPIDRTFTGPHSVVFSRIATIAGERMVRVGDGLADPWGWWPVDVARRYMLDFPGAGLTYLVVTPRRLRARVAVANVRPSPTRKAARVGTITPKSASLHVGGIVVGESVGGNRNWYRVFYRGKLAYVHASVARIL